MEMKNPKVLVAGTISFSRREIIPFFIKSLLQLSYENKKIFLIENSREEELMNAFRNLKGVEIQKTEFLENRNQMIARDKNLMRKKALEEGFDYLLSLELNVIPPKNVIEELLAQNKKICSALLLSSAIKREENKLSRVLVPLAGKFLKEKEKEIKVQNLLLDEVLPSKLLKVDICSLGCMLIHKNVLEKIEFKSDEQNAPVELLFAAECKKKGFEIFVDSYCGSKIL